MISQSLLGMTHPAIRWRYTGHLAKVDVKTRMNRGGQPNMNAPRTYLQQIRALLDRLDQTQMEAIEQAGRRCAEALLGGHHIYVSPKGTHSIATEITHRAGGFIDPTILSETATELRAGDVVIIGTNAGFDASTVGLALRCRAMGVHTIAITTVVFEEAVTSTDASGKTLHEVAEVCIDQGGVVGDALLELPGLDVPIIPPSGVLCVTAVWLVFASAAEQMVAAGKPPLVYQAIQMPGAVERNGRAAEEARRTGVGHG
jgi:uncharacterized phosphosugar-binding protein